jgi:nucleotide-binding universal stress UspA family protein
MLVAMNKHRNLMPGTYGRPRAPAPERIAGRAHRRTRRDRLDARTVDAQVLDRDPRAVHRPNRAERPGEPAATFNSVLCADDRSANSRAAYDQAVLLASPGGTVERVPAPQLAYRGRRALHDACRGHDLVALGAGPAAFAAVGRAPIPVLIARWCPLGTEVADTILVPVDDSPESSRAVELAGRLAATQGGTVTILRAPPRDPALQRAVAASGRILLQATGAAPRLFGQQLPREHAIPDAAAAIGASLVVLGAGSSENARRMTAQIAGRVGCSVLTVPALAPAPRPRFARDDEGGHAHR